MPDYPVAALVVSCLVSVLGCMVFYSLARFEFGRSVALWSLVTLLLPTGIFYARILKDCFYPLGGRLFRRPSR